VLADDLCTHPYNDNYMVYKILISNLKLIFILYENMYVIWTRRVSVDDFTAEETV